MLTTQFITLTTCKFKLHKSLRWYELNHLSHSLLNQLSPIQSKCSACIEEAKCHVIYRLQASQAFS